MTIEDVTWGDPKINFWDDPAIGYIVRFRGKLHEDAHQAQAHLEQSLHPQKVSPILRTENSLTSIFLVGDPLTAQIAQILDIQETHWATPEALHIVRYLGHLRLDSVEAYDRIAEAMTPRENFLAAMERAGPEWVPLDMGKHIGSIHRRHYADLAPLLPGVRMANGGLILDRMAQTVVPDEALLARFGVDFRWLVPNWVQVREREDVDGYIDMWGVPYRAAAGRDHYAVDGAPLKGATSIADIEA
ncbi:MAG: hypothetical protein HUU38_15810, partial [Anaerolineales bacterium]|nr:hypothetical protein [Anaerolineales bacterium]